MLLPVYLVLLVLAAQVNAVSLDYCSNIKPQNERVIEDVTIVSNGGSTRGNSVVLSPCFSTLRTPPGKTRSANSASSGRACPASLMALFGAPDSFVGCEVAFDAHLSRPVWASEGADEVRMVLLSADNMTTMSVRVLCATDDSMIISAGPSLRAVNATVHSPAACHANVAKPAPKEIHLIDVVIGVCSALVGVTVCYTVGARYARGKRGWQLVPWVRLGSGRSTSTEEYDRVPQQDDEAADSGQSGD